MWPMPFCCCRFGSTVPIRPVAITPSTIVRLFKLIISTLASVLGMPLRRFGLGQDTLVSSAELSSQRPLEVCVSQANSSPSSCFAFQPGTLAGLPQPAFALCCVYLIIPSYHPLIHVWIHLQIKQDFAPEKHLGGKHPGYHTSTPELRVSTASVLEVYLMNSERQNTDPQPEQALGTGISPVALLLLCTSPHPWQGIRAEEPSAEMLLYPFNVTCWIETAWQGSSISSPPSHPLPSSLSELHCCLQPVLLVAWIGILKYPTLALLTWLSGWVST